MLLDLLFHSRQSTPILVSKVLGCFFLMLGSVVGMFFLFQSLVPIVGYLESGAIAGAALIVLGIGFLMLGQSKKPAPSDEIAEKALNFFNDFDLEKYLKNNALPLSLLSLGIGVILSQLKPIKNLPGMDKILK